MDFAEGTQPPVGGGALVSSTQASIALPRAAQAARESLAEWQFLCAVALVVTCLKVALIVLDPHVRLFMGDSASYLASAVQGWTPPDRSFTYPLLIRFTAVASGSIGTLLLVQTLLGAATAMLLCVMLRSAFGVRRTIAAAAAALLALDPAQLFYERMVMTEAVSTFVLIATLLLALAYLRTGRLRSVLGCIALGVVLVSLRVGLVPVALALGIVVVLLRTPRAAASMPRWLLHLFVAVLATWSGHQAYKHWYAARAGGEPAYIRYSGIFRLGLVAPLITATEMTDAGLDPAMLEEITIPLNDERRREQQIWLRGGLIDVMQRHVGERSESAAAALAAQVIAHNPLAVLRLGLRTELDYFDASLRRERMWSDLGSGQPPDALTLDMLRRHFGYDAEGLAGMPSPIWLYFGASAPWLMFCLFALTPLALTALALSRYKYRRATVLLALMCAGFVAGHTICSHIVSFRYLHPMPPLMLACLAIVVDNSMLRIAVRRRERRAS